MADAEPESGAFRHLSAPNAAEYRRVLRAFSAARDAGWLLLRPAEVVGQARGEEATLTEDAAVALLAQLTGWGNLERSADRARATTIEQFQRVGYLYSLSPGGLACEQALRMSSRLSPRVGSEDLWRRRIACHCDPSTRWSVEATAAVHQATPP